MVSALRLREAGLQLLADDLVKEGLLRLAALVLGHETLESVGAIHGAGIRRS